MMQDLDSVFGLSQDGLPPPAATWNVYYACTTYTHSHTHTCFSASSWIFVPAPIPIRHITPPMAKGPNYKHFKFRLSGHG